MGLISPSGGYWLSGARGVNGEGGGLLKREGRGSWGKQWEGGY